MKNKESDPMRKTLQENGPLVIAGKTSVLLAGKIAGALGSEIVSATHKQFDDGEMKIAITQDIRHQDVVVVASAAGNPNDNEKETRLLLKAAGKRGGASSVTLLLPYMWYGRADDTWGETTEPALIDTIETLRPHCDKTIIVDPHNASLTRELFMAAAANTCMPVHFAEDFAKELRKLMQQKSISFANLMLAHADAGSVKRIGPDFRRDLYTNLKMQNRNPMQDDWPMGMKDRDKTTGQIQFKGFSADVKGRDVVIFEDMIASGGTAAEIAKILKKQGAHTVTLCATSALFTAKAGSPDKMAAVNKINASELDHVLVTDTYDHSQTNHLVHNAMYKSPKIKVIGTAPHLARIIRDLHDPACVRAVSSGRLNNRI